MKQTTLSKRLPKADHAQFAEHVMQRFCALDSAMADWRAPRARRWREFENDYTHRSGTGDSKVSPKKRNDCPDLDGIFELQNDSSKDIAAIAAFMIARAFEDLLGTSPWMDVEDETPPQEIPGATVIQSLNALRNHGETRFNQSSFKQVALQALTCAAVKDEAIMKLTWRRDSFWSCVPRTALHGAAGPIKDVTGELIKDQARVQEEPVEGQENPRVFLVDEPERDLMPEGPFTWEEVEDDEEIVHYEGLDPVVVSHGDFVAPLNIASLEEADCCGQWISMRLSDAVRQYGLSPEEAEKLRNAYDDSPKVESDEPDPNRGEQVAENTPHDDRFFDPFVKFAEAYWTGPILADGRRRRALVVIDSKSRELIYLDDLANVTPKGMLPYFPIMYFQAKEDRWYGVGHYNKFEDDQDYVDRMDNYIGWRNRYNSNPMIIEQTEAFEKEDEEDEDDGTLFPGRVRRLMPNAGLRPDEAFMVIPMPDLDERTVQLREGRRANMQIRSGVTSATMGQVGTIPQNSTATGIESIMQSGQTIFAPQIGLLREGFQRFVWYGLQLLARKDPPQISVEVDGERVPLDLRAVQDLSYRVTLKMTRFHRRMEMENAMQVIELVMRYITVPEEEKDAVRGAFLQAVEAAGFQNADEIIRKALPLLPPPAPGTEDGTVVPFDTSNQSIEEQI